MNDTTKLDFHLPCRYRQTEDRDRIRILRVPEADLRQREREIEEGTERAGWTADTIERIIESQPVSLFPESTNMGPFGMVLY